MYPLIEMLPNIIRVLGLGLTVLSTMIALMGAWTLCAENDEEEA